MGEWLWQGLLAFCSALVLGSFLEYAVHRLMHHGKLLGKKHAEHHRDGWGQGVLGEFRDYLVGSAPVILAGVLASAFLLDCTAAAVGFGLGGLVYAALAAYAHQLQHERPELVFWLKRPVHHLHHKHHMWHHNFGILVDFWDRVFGTYQPVEWQPEKRLRDFPLRTLLHIQWLQRT